MSSCRFFLQTKASHLCRIICYGRECSAWPSKCTGLQGVLNCSRLPCLSVLRKMRKVRGKQFAGASSAKFLDMWDLMCLKVSSSILSEEGNKDFKPKWNQIPQASLAEGCELLKKERTISTSFCSYCTVHPRISEVFRNANELSIHPMGWLSGSVCMLQTKKQRHSRLCGCCVWHSGIRFWGRLPRTVSRCPV